MHREISRNRMKKYRLQCGLSTYPSQLEGSEYDGPGEGITCILLSFSDSPVLTMARESGSCTWRNRYKPENTEWSQTGRVL